MLANLRRFGLVALVLAAAAGVAFAAAIKLGAIHWDDANQRWRDVVTNPFATAKQTAYSYEQAAVSVNFDDTAYTLKGTIAATALKPNFAYQLKLNGKPTFTWGADGDDWANEKLGYAGRWWVDEYDNASGTPIWVSGWNSSDSEYNSWKAKGFTDSSNLYVFQGYLLFDFIVTDAAGNATKTFQLDSALHVLWKTSARTPTAKDSTPRAFSVVAQKSSGWYAQNYTTKNVSIYGEWEPGRALPGTLVLPQGSYNVRLFLTEESFHETATVSGYWATVMADDALAFTVDGTAPPTGATIVSVTAANARTSGKYNIVAALQNNSPSVATKVSLDCLVSGTSSQGLTRKTVTIPAGGTATVTWTDSVAKNLKAGTYTATVTVVGTTQTKTSNAFQVTK